MRVRLRQLASIVLLLVIWELTALKVGRDILPDPALVWTVLWNLIATGSFAEPLLASLLRVIAGFAVAYTLGIIYGILAGRSRRWRTATTATVLTMLFAPTVVVIFVALLILGINNWASLCATVVIVFPALGIYMRDVMRDVDSELIEMAESYKAGSLSRALGIYVPYLTPALLSAARTGFAHAWKIVFLAEVFGLPDGLGFQVRQAYGVFNLRGVIAWLIVFIIVMLIIEQLIRLIEHRVVRWQL